MSDTVDPKEVEGYPTPEEINALPDKVRAYIHDLETRCDKSGDLRRLKLLERLNQELQAALMEARDENEELRERVKELGDKINFMERNILAALNVSPLNVGPEGVFSYRVALKKTREYLTSAYDWDHEKPNNGDSGNGEGDE